MAASSQAQLYDHKQSIDITQPPTDSISALEFNPTQDIIAASSWDNMIRLWQVDTNSGQSMARHAYGHDQPVLDISWAKDGTKLFSAGADKMGKVLDMNTLQAVQFAQHDAPIKCVKALDNQCIITGSWDKTLRVWDLRQQTPAMVMNVPERIYAMDVVSNLLVVGTAERGIVIYNLQNPQQPFKSMISPLKWQTRCLAAFPDGKGFAIGSIEGRVGIQYVEDKDSSLNFSFKCHRGNNNDVYAVNEISFHPVHGTFSTAGSDGTFNFWDKDSKQRLKTSTAINDPAQPNVLCPIPATSFNRDGRIFAYAASYDWSRGYEHSRQGQRHRILLYAVKDDDVKQRNQKKPAGR
ncbi:hypothetical protein SmJEL517_g04315 [Synchytrium microbalum]|uniref:Uncharacterized protein n=1 Tax=Synchytrium microbalum TaxID=1806994 RepID=A0A507BZU4_9FUNG|nr:uncharacterized protein SmJEL517_g04315 [Synchytrium microbalum]TPX32638.1 hypothetical protein SmJEL517_g04315 [Synchytrium microbalum]